MSNINRDQLLSPFVRMQAHGTFRGQQIAVRNLTEAERCELLDKGQTTADGKPNPKHLEQWRRKVVIACACDPETMEPLLTPADLARLRNADAAMISAYYVLAIKHCGLTADEDAEKNSDSASDDDSPTD